MPNPLWDALFAPLAARTAPLLTLRDGTVITGAAFLAIVAQQAHALLPTPRPGCCWPIRRALWTGWRRGTVPRC